MSRGKRFSLEFFGAEVIFSCLINAALECKQLERIPDPWIQWRRKGRTQGSCFQSHKQSRGTWLFQSSLCCLPCVKYMLVISGLRKKKSPMRWVPSCFLYNQYDMIMIYFLWWKCQKEQTKGRTPKLSGCPAVSVFLPSPPCHEFLRDIPKAPIMEAPTTIANIPCSWHWSLIFQKNIRRLVPAPSKGVVLHPKGLHFYHLCGPARNSSCS